MKDILNEMVHTIIENESTSIKGLIKELEKDLDLIEKASKKSKNSKIKEAIYDDINKSIDDIFNSLRDIMSKKLDKKTVKKEKTKDSKVLVNRYKETVLLIKSVVEELSEDIPIEKGHKILQHKSKVKKLLLKHV